MAYSEYFSAPGINLGGNVPLRIWNPGIPDDIPLPLLVMHDGWAYDDVSHLTERLSSLISSRSVMSHRVALVDPEWGKRNDWYGASPAYQDTLANSVIPEICKRVEVIGPVIGGGASLGAIGILGCEYAFPGTFGGAFLQSASFHHKDYGTDDMRDKYGEYDRVAALVENIRGTPLVKKLHIGMTWNEGQGVPGNNAMSKILSDHDHIMSGGIVPGGHDYYSWGCALIPHLGSLLARCWSDSSLG